MQKRARPRSVPPADEPARKAVWILSTGKVVGYAVECALNASVAKQIREHDFPDKKLVVDSHRHDLGKLLNLSGLRAAFDQTAASDPSFAVNWATIKD